jgi:SAM-dependent methyltransferase
MYVVKGKVMEERALGRFAFGKNWRRFIDADLTDERVEIAQRHLLEFLGATDLRGRRMIDIGCGSGIHSLAAIKAGASCVVSFDYDPESVAATLQLRGRHGSPAHWRVEQGSILDRAYVAGLGQFDLVYAWGVLHHTGDLWTAFQNAVALVADGGVFYLALYAAEVARPSPEFWLAIKRRYNAGGAATRFAIEAWYAARTIAGLIRRGRNPISYIAGYKRSRGMAFLTDVRDWVGGWPMEYSTVAEVERAAARAGLRILKTKLGEANTEYLLARQGKANPAR